MPNCMLYQFSIEFMQYLSLTQGRRSPELKVWDIEMIRKSCQNSVSLHFGTPEPDKHGFNGELVLSLIRTCQKQKKSFDSVLHNLYNSKLSGQGNRFPVITHRFSEKNFCRAEKIFCSPEAAFFLRCKKIFF